MRIAIVGTAGTWKDTPWQDKTLQIWSLNDAFMIGMPRWDVWFEQHPLTSFVFRQTTQPISHDPALKNPLPPGKHLRPIGYLDWLKTQAQRIPVYLNDMPPVDWPMAQRYPLESILERYRCVLQIDPTWPHPYSCSGPTWMLLLALMQGATEILITGIHLSTDREYVEQRPNFELMIGYAIGLGVKIVIPPGTPICKATSLYCYEPRMSQLRDPVELEVQRLKAKQSTIVEAMLAASPRRRYHLQEDLFENKAHLADAQDRLNRMQFEEQVRRPEWRAA